MNYRIIPVTAFSQNCSLIWCEQTRLAALVDPGGDAEKIKQEVDASGLTLMLYRCYIALGIRRVMSCFLMIGQSC